MESEGGTVADARTAPAQGAILTTGLVKRYGDLTALDGLDLNVPEGTVLALLGPNGAGKTTAVRILTTLLPADGGSAWVAGIDVAANPHEVRRRIGLSGQYAAVDEYLTGTENLDMIGRLYHLGKAASRSRAVELMERFGLEDAADRPVKTYSGGMRRRLDLAGALVAKPTVLFLDEPTTGLDPAGRADMWDVIRELVGQGTTLLLTTQYMEEADLLADEIVVIDHGKCIERGTADELKQRAGAERIELVVSHAGDIPEAMRVLAGYSLNGVQLDERSRRLTVPVPGGADTLRRVLLDLDGLSIGLSDVGLRRPTLDDVFLSLTGHTAEWTQEDDAAVDAEEAHEHEEVLR
jgi:ABC-2 type transport system ATP-binding protein